MADCYICGKPHAEYKRRVQTGTSHTTTYSSKGTTYDSLSVQHGIRSVCARCALNIDYDNRRYAGVIIGLFIGGLLVLAGLSGVSVQFIMTYPQGVACIFAGVIVFALVSAYSLSAAAKWKKANEGKYIDSYDVMQQQEEQRLRELENAKRDEFIKNRQALIDIITTFQAEMQNEIDYLTLKAEVFSKEHEVCNVDSIGEIDKILVDITLFVNEIKKEHEKTEDLYSKFVKQIEKLCLENEADKYIQKPEKVKDSIVETIINPILAQCREHENKMLQEKIKLLQGQRITNTPNKGI